MVYYVAPAVITAIGDNQEKKILSNVLYEYNIPEKLDGVKSMPNLQQFMGEEVPCKVNLQGQTDEVDILVKTDMEDTYSWVPNKIKSDAYEPYDVKGGDYHFDIKTNKLPTMQYNYTVASGERAWNMGGDSTPEYVIADDTITKEPAIEYSVVPVHAYIPGLNDDTPIMAAADPGNSLTDLQPGGTMQDGYYEHGVVGTIGYTVNWDNTATISKEPGRLPLTAANITLQGTLPEWATFVARDGSELDIATAPYSRNIEFIDGKTSLVRTDNSDRRVEWKAEANNATLSSVVMSATLPLSKTTVDGKEVPAAMTIVDKDGNAVASMAGDGAMTAAEVAAAVTYDDTKFKVESVKRVGDKVTVILNALSKTEIVDGTEQAVTDFYGHEIPNPVQLPADMTTLATLNLELGRSVTQDDLNATLTAGSEHLDLISANRPQMDQSKEPDEAAELTGWIKSGWTTSEEVALVAAIGHLPTTSPETTPVADMGKNLTMKLWSYDPKKELTYTFIPRDADGNPRPDDKFSYSLEQDMPLWTKTGDTADNGWTGNSVGTGLFGQNASLLNIGSGVYDMEITKEGHGVLTIHNLEITKDGDGLGSAGQGNWKNLSDAAHASDLRLRVGDMNKDENINMGDYSDLNRVGIFGQTITEDNKATLNAYDLDGDGSISMNDLVILTDLNNFGKSSTTHIYLK